MCQENENFKEGKNSPLVCIFNQLYSFFNYNLLLLCLCKLESVCGGHNGLTNLLLVHWTVSHL